MIVCMVYSETLGRFKIRLLEMLTVSTVCGYPDVPGSPRFHVPDQVPQALKVEPTVVTESHVAEINKQTVKGIMLTVSSVLF